MQVRSHEDTLIEHAIIARWRLHLHPLVRLSFYVVSEHLFELIIVFVPLRVNQRLVEVKDEQLVEASLFELKFYLVFSANFGECLDLLNDVDRLNDLHGYLFVYGDFQRLIREVLILLEDVLGLERGCRRRFLRMRGLFNRAGNVACLTLTFATGIVLTFSEGGSSQLLRVLGGVVVGREIAPIV